MNGQDRDKSKEALLDELVGLRRQILGLKSAVAERYKVEERLQESQRRLATLISNLPGIAYRCRSGPDWVIEFVSHGCLELTGYLPSDLIHNQKISFSQIIHPDDRESAWASIASALKENRPYQLTYRVRTASGEEKWIWDQGRGVYHPQGELEAFEGLMTDITRKKISEEALREVSQFNQQIITHAQEGIVVYDRDLRYVTWNPYMEKLSGLPGSDVLGKLPQEVFSLIEARGHYVLSEESRQAIFQALRKALTGETVSLPDVPYFVKAAGEFGWASGRYGPLRDAQGEVTGVIATIHVVTERRRVEEALRENQRMLATLMSNLPGLAYRCRNDRDRTLEFASEGCLQLTGYSPNDLIGNQMTSYAHLIHPDDRESLWNEVQEAVRDHRPFRLVYRIRTAGGTICWVWEQGRGVFSPDGSLLALEGFITDITDRKRTEEEVLKTQKLESLGLLAGGIAHDFNNILTGILGNVSLAKMRMDPQDRLYRRMEEAEKAALRAKDLSHQLLTFAKGGAPIKRVVSLRSLLKEGAEFALRGSNVRCEFSLPQDLWTVYVDIGQINQVIHNLVLNAKESMPAGGVVRIEGENADIRGSAQGIPIPDGRYLRIAVRDEGAGIPKEHLTKIFDPYFTTKDKGNGLGLSTSYSIIRRHGGYMTAESEVGIGTTFWMFLPATAEEAVDGPVRSPKTILRGKGRILIMDDEALVRDVAAEMLLQVGYEVEAVRDGAEAVAIYKKAKASNQPFDAVIFDLTVPGGMNGQEALDKLREIDPGVRAIVSSGYSNDPIMADYKIHGFHAVVVKPYQLDQLSSILYDVLGPVRD